MIQHKRTDRIYELSIKYKVAGSMTSPYDLREMTRAHRAFTQKNERWGLDKRVKILNGVLKASRGLKKVRDYFGIEIALLPWSCFPGTKWACFLTECAIKEDSRADF